MTPEEQRLAIAEEVGFLKRKEGEIIEYQDFRGPDAVFQRVRFPNGRVSPCYIEGIPYYPSDLNAMHELEKIIPEHKRGYYNAELSKTSNGGRNLSSTVKNPDFIFLMLHATAAQRAEAFLRTIGKWTE